MKKEFNVFEPITNDELNEIAGGSESQPNFTPLTVTVPISLAACPTTRCASIVSPCNE